VLCVLARREKCQRRWSNVASPVHHSELQCPFHCSIHVSVLGMGPVLGKRPVLRRWGGSEKLWFYRHHLARLGALTCDDARTKWRMRVRGGPARQFNGQQGADFTSIIGVSLSRRSTGSKVAKNLKSGLDPRWETPGMPIRPVDCVRRQDGFDYFCHPSYRPNTSWKLKRGRTEIVSKIEDALAG
jgi:hypothetical protein